MAYLINQFIIEIIIFVILITLTIIGLRSRTVVIHELTMHARAGDSCPLSMDLTVMNALRRVLVLPRVFMHT